MTATAKLGGTATFPTISGWTKSLEVTVGGGVDGAGTGTQRFALYIRTAAGTESGTVTVTPNGPSNVVQATISSYSCNAGNTFSLDVASGSMATASTSVVTDADHVMGETAGNMMFFSTTAAANTNLGSQTVTATGATYGTAAERVDTGTNSGNDSRLSHCDRPITSGTASAATHYTGTATAATTAGTIFVRLSEVVSAGNRGPDRRRPRITRRPARSASFAR